MSKATLGEEIIAAVSDALASKSRGSLLRPHIEVAKIRKELHLTQREFSERYFIKLETLRNWEQGKRIPDTASMAYLLCITKQPKLIAKILHER